MNGVVQTAKAIEQAVLAPIVRRLTESCERNMSEYKKANYLSGGGGLWGDGSGKGNFQGSGKEDGECEGRSLSYESVHTRGYGSGGGEG